MDIPVARRMRPMISPFIVVGVMLILTPIFGMMTYDRLEKHKAFIQDRMVVRGSSVIHTIEAGARTGMRAMGWGWSRVQILLQETVYQPDVLWIMVVSEDGTIVAHSDADQVGRMLDPMPGLQALDPDDPRSVAWRIRQNDPEPVFEVYKRFTPLRSGRSAGGMHRMAPRETCEELPDAVILAGISMERARLAQRHLVRETLIRGAFFFVMGCAGVISLTVWQAYRTARASLTRLTREVESTRHLAEIGKLAAGVAHEIRNPLSSIKGFATYFETRYRDNPEDRETAQIMIQEVARINRAVTQLLEFAKPMAADKKEVDIRKIVDHSLKLISHDLDRKAIAARVAYHSTRTRFPTDPDRLNQVLLNLYMNSLAAMEARGTLTVTVSDRLPGTDLEICVTDDGCGMDAATLSEIFDPYFTTRPDGTGLGLAIVHRIIEQLGGSISVQSARGKGTTFCIRLDGPEKRSAA